MSWKKYICDKCHNVFNSRNNYFSHKVTIGLCVAFTKCSRCEAEICQSPYPKIICGKCVKCVTIEYILLMICMKREKLLPPILVRRMIAEQLLK